MHVEKMIYAYLMICVAMIIFNCVSILFFRRRDKWLNRHSYALEKAVVVQLERLRRGEPIEKAHVEMLGRKLRFVANLMVFDGTLSNLMEGRAEDEARYLQALRPLFGRVAEHNFYHNPMQRAYFAYIVKKYRVLEEDAPPAVVAFMLELLKEPSLYARENALQAIYSTGNCQLVLRAMRAMEVAEEFHHGKLLTDGLLSFSGDREALMALLWERFEIFSVPMQVAILDFIRFGGGHMAPEILAILVDDKRDDELRFSCLRYFGKMKDEAAYPVLLDFLERPYARRWEYAAIAATSLGSYQNARTINALKQALYSDNWYIRFNAAKSLERFKLTYLELSDVMNSGDRHAREILQYQFDVQRAKEERGGGTA